MVDSCTRVSGSVASDCPAPPFVVKTATALPDGRELIGGLGTTGDPRSSGAVALVTPGQAPTVIAQFPAQVTAIGHDDTSVWVITTDNYTSSTVWKAPLSSL